MNALKNVFCTDPRTDALLHPSPEDLQGLEMAIKQLRGPSGTPSSPNVVFQYASALISHVDPSYIREGIQLMEGLVFLHWQEERNRRVQADNHSSMDPGTVPTAPPDSEVEGNGAAAAPPLSNLPVYYYYIALGWIKLKDLVKARSSIERMLKEEPNNRQGQALRDYIDHEETRDGVVGLAGLTAAVAAAAVFIGFLKSK